MKWPLRHYQRTFCQAVVDAFAGKVNDTPFTKVLGTAATGAGKCWMEGTPMLLANGEILPVEDLKPGMALIGPDSQKRTIVSTNQGSDLLYLIEPQRHAEPMVVNGSHILSLKCTNIGKRRLTLPDGSQCGTGDVVFITVDDFQDASKTAKHCLKWWQTGFDLHPETGDETPIPPWLLGFWLADGSSRHAEIHKPGAVEWCREDVEKMGWSVHRKKLADGKCECASITGGFRVALRKANLLENKHIPISYLRASREIRMTLLAGILDGDGYSTREGFELTLKDGKLPQDCAILARSLGFSVSVSDKFVNGETYRRAHLYGGPNLPTKRHPERIRRQKKDPLVTGFKVKFVGYGNYHGVTLDGPDRQLLMPDGTVSHNTIIASALIERWTGNGRKVLMLADTDELCDQSLEKIHKSTGIIADLEKASSRASRMASAVVGSIQSMQGRLERYQPDHFRYVIADEAHMSMAAGWQKTLNYFHGGGARILGITATPERGDKQSLMKFYEHVAAEIPMAQLITEKHLSPIVVETVPLEISIHSKIGNGDADNDAVAEELLAYYSAIIDAIERHAADRKKFLIFHPSVKASKRFTSLLRERGHTAAHVDGSSPDRAEIVEGFLQSRFRFLNNCAMLTKGFDCPDVDCVIILSPTRSRTNYIQKAGRGTRLYCPHGCTEWCDHPDRKENLLLLDFLWECEGHDIMGPADLMTDAPQQRKELARKLKTGEKLDLMAADAFVTGEREADLLAKLKQQAGKRGSKIDAVAFAALIHQPELMEYESVSPWQKSEPTVRQVEALEKAGLAREAIIDRGHASALMNAVVGRIQERRATVPQIMQLIKHKVPGAETMSFDEASRTLDGIFSKFRNNARTY